jgi:exonuclease I
MSVHYILQNTDHQQMHKESYIVNCNTLLHVSTLLGQLQGEFFVIVTLRLHFTVECECAVDCVLCCFWRPEPSAVPGNFSLKMTQQGRNM